MKDDEKTREQLLEELTELRHRVATLETVEAELWKSRAILQATIDNLPFDFFAIGMDGRYMLQNATSKAHWGDAVGKLPEDAAGNEETLVLWEENNRRAFAGEKVEEDVTLTIKGENRYCHNVIAPIIDTGRIQGILGVNIDITDRKRAEERLRESESRFRSLFQESSVGAAVVTPNSQFLQVNRAFCDFLGYSESELIGQTVLSVTHPDDRESSSTAIRQAAESVAPLQRLEKPYLHKCGQVVWGEVSSTLMHDTEGKPDYFITQILDITERKRADEALKKAHDELERRVEERTVKLAEASQQLRREIEERKAAEETLRESEEKYKTLVETSPDVVIMTDLTGHVTFVSRRLLDLHGVDSADEFLGKTAGDYLVSEDHDKYRLSLQDTIENSITRDVEYTFIKKNGTRFPAELSAALVKDASGKAVAIINVLRDITERKLAEEALRQSERRFRNYFEQGLIGMAVTSVDKRWLEVNDRLCEILGYSREELVQTSWAELTHPDDLEENCRLFNQLLVGDIENFTLDKRYIKKDGGIVYTTIHTRAFRKEDGTIDHIVLLVEDITARKQAEEALRQNHDELRTIYEEITDGIVIVSVENPRPLRANAALCRMLGYSEEEMRNLSPTQVHSPETLSAVREQLEMAKQKGIARSSDVPFLRKDGSVFYADVTVSQIIYNRQPCWVSVIHDITERKHAQDALERERQSLWRMLQASDHERQTISYEIHDGLAQYLAAAGMQFQAHDSLRENSPDKAKKAYETALELVRQAHSESRRLISEVRHPVIDESGLETAISHLVHEQRRRGGPTIKFDSEVQFKRLPSILENAIYRIAQEALTNACKHSKSKKVTVTMTQEGQDVRLEVRDWGIGFDPEAIGKGHFGVEGIRQRVRLLDGRLTIESKPGSGTLVQVVVPILEREIGG
ncbi:MAG: PAS domain S-box protein [Thermoguttaceae bacterium]